jgi:hypothetical protein
MIVIKEEFVGSEKYRRAVKLGRSDAIVMWLALKCYASLHATSEGFIPDEDLDELPGAPRAARKALQALVACGRLLPDGTRSQGLVEPAPGGWQLHDYLDHSVSPEELELRRERARLKKQRQRADQRQELETLRAVRHAVDGMGKPGDMSPGQQGDRRGHVPGDKSRPTPGATPSLSPEDGRGGAPAPARGHARPPPLPSPPQPTFKSLDLINESPEPGPISVASARMPDPIDTEHRRFAAEHELDIDAIAFELCADPATPFGAEALRHALTKRLMDAAAAREKVARESVEGVD